MNDPFSRRLIFVTGKGGVGKTTVAAALAVRLADAGRRVLLMETGQLSSTAALFGTAEPGYTPQQVRPGIHLVRITPAECLREYGLRKLKLRRLFDLVFGNAFVKALVHMLPGMEDLLAIGKIGFTLQAVLKGRSAFDVIVVDMPPTSQGLGLLNIPSIMFAAVGSGAAAREMGEIRDLLTDPATTGAVLVTLAEELAVDEAQELEVELRATGIPACAMVVNRVITVAGGPARSAAGELVRQLAQEQEDQVKRIRGSTALPVILLPLLAGLSDDEKVLRLAEKLEAEAVAEAGNL